MTQNLTELGIAVTNELNAVSVQSEEIAAWQRAVITDCTLKLRTAYPTQARNFSASEVDNTNRLWLEMFEDVDPLLLKLAVDSFIRSDRSGFFPTVGQIGGELDALTKRICSNSEYALGECRTCPNYGAITSVDGRAGSNYGCCCWVNPERWKNVLYRKLPCEYRSAPRVVTRAAERHRLELTAKSAELEAILHNQLESEDPQWQN